MKVLFKEQTYTRASSYTVKRGVVAKELSVLFLVIVSDGCYGVGEVSLATGSNLSRHEIKKMISDFLACHDIAKFSIHEIYDAALKSEMPMPAVSAIDAALWDLYGNKITQPCYKIFGLKKIPIPASITIGINPPEQVREQTYEALQRTKARALKVKLGSSDSLDVDKEVFLAAHQVAKTFSAAVSVDANGGWTYKNAKQMLTFLAKHNVKHLEQPLIAEDVKGMKKLFGQRTFPIFADESCVDNKAIFKLAECFDGVNVKLTKSGGVSGALRTINCARANNMKVLLGCRTETSIGISAAVTIGALADCWDLDSHLNILNNPPTGLELSNGYIRVSEGNGFGTHLAPLAFPGVVQY